MRITKLEHAALVIEHDAETLLIDPGNFTRPIEPVDAVTAVVITHRHPDHWTPEHLDRVIAASPDVRLFGPTGVVEAASDHRIEQVSPGDAITVGAFSLRFFGGTHAVIHASIPVIDNVGVLVNDELYYGGDAYDYPADVPIGTLAVPANAPWMRLAESMDYVLAVAPPRAFGTHDGLLSDAGKKLASARLEWSTAQGNGRYHALAPGDSLDL